ncbi:MAG: hypothetical protein LBC07_04140, partial [Elusimicrobiota bacterium]|nr:hypothetical protein [Elusimicrobiota bacterium]
FENSNLNFKNNISNLNGSAIFANAKSSVSFINSSASFTNNLSSNLGGAILINNSQIFFYNSYITFKNNRAATTLNDIALDGENAIMRLYGRNNFSNGIRTSGGQNINSAGEIFVNGNTTFSGEASNIQNSFTIESGAVNFTNSGSKIKILNVLDTGKLSLLNFNTGNKLYIETLNLNGIIEMDAAANAADRLFVSGAINLADTNKFSLNLLTNQNSIVILAESASINGKANSAASDKYFIFQTNNNIFAKIGPDPSKPNKARVSTWNDFVTIYQNAMLVENDEIILMDNLSAKNDDRAISKTAANIAFIVNGNGFSLNAQKLENAFFDLDADEIIFKNISFLNFKNTNSMGAGAINADNASKIHLTGNINFNNNFSDDKPNDITLKDENSVIVFDNNTTLINGIRTKGAGRLEKISDGELTFQGAKTIIENQFNVLAGQLNFKSAISSINYLNMNYGTSLSLQDNKAGEKLYAGQIIMRSNLMLDIDFKSAIADQIFASSITIFSGYKLTIKDLHPLDLTETEIPIIIASSSQTFTIIGQQPFNYDKNLYALRYEKGKLFIKNKKPPDIEEDGDSPNREETVDIVNDEGGLKIPLSRLDLNERRKALDSLSGVFITNIFVSHTQDKSEFLFNQIKQEAPLEKVWINANYSAIEFSKHEQTLGKFKMRDMAIDIGGDFYGTQIDIVIARVGAYASVNTKEFRQDENKAGLNDFGFGIYENTNIANFNLQFLAGVRYANVNTSRIIKIDKDYNPIAEFNIVSIESALNVDYSFDIKTAEIGPFVLLSASQNSFKEFSEHGGLITDLNFNQTSWTKAQMLIGGQIKGSYNFIDVFAKSYAGFLLVKDPAFYTSFTSIENSTMRIQSDRVNEIFYGAQAGINAKANEDITVGIMGYGQISHSFAHYGAQLKFTYTLRGEMPKIPFLESSVKLGELTLKDKQSIKYFVKKFLHSNEKSHTPTLKIYLNVSEDEAAVQIDKAKLRWAQKIYSEILKNGFPASSVRVIKYKIKPMVKTIKVKVES